MIEALSSCKRGWWSIRKYDENKKQLLLRISALLFLLLLPPPSSLLRDRISSELTDSKAEKLGVEVVIMESTQALACGWHRLPFLRPSRWRYCYGRAARKKDAAAVGTWGAWLEPWMVLSFLSFLGVLWPELELRFSSLFIVDHWFCLFGFLMVMEGKNGFECVWDDCLQQSDVFLVVLHPCP